MREFIRKNISYREGGLTILVVFLLFLFCQIVHFPLIIPLLLLFIGVHLFFFGKASLGLFLRLGLLLAAVVFAANLFTQYPTVNSFYIPVASIAILTMLLFNDVQVSFIMAFLSSLLVTLVFGKDLPFMLIFFVGGLTGAYTVRDARTRGTLLNAGVYVGIIQAFMMILWHPEMFFVMSRDFVLRALVPLAANGVLAAFFVMASLKLFETWFGVVTNFSLLELSDFNNQPILRRMTLEAPGTAHHSLMVSNLAESAADAIGANALLTRVGAYYHDIGKTEKAEYFTENQIIGGNKHDDIEPSISRLVILNHVTEGVDLVRKYKLNPILADFIRQHHGTSLMHFFYQRALEGAEDPSEIKEENYRYPGPKPQTREAAIVLLADSVEAATRSLDEVNPQKIEEVARKIINNKFIDGQLDECTLTLKEIELIARTFTRILSAMYHARIKYPEKKNGSDNRNQKSAEEDTPSTPPDHKDRTRDS